MSKVILQLSVTSLVVVSLAVLIAFIWLGFYAYPSADDFCMVNGVNQQGLLPHLWNHYFEWSGRYSGNAFYAIYPLLFGLFDGYRFIAAFLILSLFAATAFLLSKLFKMKMTAIPILLISLCFVAIYLLGLRHTASSLYWMAGSLSYQTANILILVSLGLIFQLIDRQQAAKNYSIVFVTLLFVIILGMGTNETNMVSLTGVLSVVLLIHLRSGWVTIKPWLLLLSVALICFSIVYLAPGNTVRVSTFPLRHDWLRSVTGSANMGLWTLIVWTGNPVFIAATLLAPFAVSSLYQTSERSFSISSSLIVVLILVTLMLPFVLQFPAWWSMGGWPPPRTVDAIFFVFLLSWFFMLGAVTIRFMPRVMLFSEHRKFTFKAVSLLFAASLLFVLAVLINGKFQRAQNDLWNLAKPFNEYIQNRHTLINNALASHQLFLTVPAFKQAYPRSIYFNDIRQDPRDWRNICYSEYFGLQGIALAQYKKAIHINPEK